MKEILSIFKAFFAYLVRPQLYPELFRKIYKNIFDRKSAFKGKDDAVKWCESLAVSQEELMKNVFNVADFKTLESQFPEILNEAKIIEKNCPVKMGGAGALDLIYNLAEHTKAKNVLETGVAYGWSSLAVLLSLQKRDGTLYSSDMPYLGKDNDHYVGCVVPQNLKKFWKLYRFADKESLPKIFKEKTGFDFVHYDSDKSYNGRMWAYPILWGELRNGGVLMSDDIGDNAAFMDFCKVNNFKPYVVGFDGKFAGFIIK